VTAEFWRMGATPVPSAEIAEIARRHEGWGWDGLAVGEAHGLLPDPYAVLAVAAAGTSTLKLGTAVAVPLRHPLLAAGAMATLQGLSNGRASFSIGRGDGAMKVLQRGPMRVAEFDSYVRRVQGYLRREDVEIDGVVSTIARADDIDPSLEHPPPALHVAATGPRTIEVAARWADGVSFSVGADVDRLRRAIARARGACHDAGRDPDTLSLGCYVQVAVTDEDDAAAREAIRGLVVTHARFSGFEPRAAVDVDSSDHGRYRAAVERMETVYHDPRGGVARTPGGRPGEVDFYPREAGADDLIDRFAIAGPAAYCAERLQEIVDLGVRRVYVGTRAVGVDLDERNAERIGRHVLSLLAGAHRLGAR
jgi:5,10-methylenetetrahydromethanopterin reductase